MINKEKIEYVKAERKGVKKNLKAKGNISERKRERYTIIVSLRKSLKYISSLNKENLSRFSFVKLHKSTPKIQFD